jgi:hypothetical protein
MQCGTCCFSTSPEYVRVTGDDYARLGERAADLTVFVGIRAFMAMSEGHCAALTIDAENGRFICDAYEDRPAACRDLEEGSRECEGELMTKSERPKAALASLVTLRNKKSRA